MKKYLIAMTLLLTLAAAQPTTTWAQKKTQQKELVDSTAKDEVAAFSDTTGVADSYDSTVVSRNHRLGGHVSIDGDSFFNDIFGLTGGMMGSMLFALIVITIIFVIAPVLIIGLLLFFIYKNRKQKMKLAEMAMRQGQPIPDQLLVEQQESDSNLWQKGLRQTFLGVGLLAFFGYVNSTIGIGIGILVTVIGLGKLAIVKTGRKVES